MDISNLDYSLLDEEGLDSEVSDVISAWRDAIKGGNKAYRKASKMANQTKALIETTDNESLKNFLRKAMKEVKRRRVQANRDLLNNASSFLTEGISDGEVDLTTITMEDYQSWASTRTESDSELLPVWKNAVKMVKHHENQMTNGDDEANPFNAMWDDGVELESTANQVFSKVEDISSGTDFRMASQMDLIKQVEKLTEDYAGEGDPAQLEDEEVLKWLESHGGDEVDPEAFLESFTKLVKGTVRHESKKASLVESESPFRIAKVVNTMQAKTLLSEEGYFSHVQSRVAGSKQVFRSNGKTVAIWNKSKGLMKIRKKSNLQNIFE